MLELQNNLKNKINEFGQQNRIPTEDSSDLIDFNDYGKNDHGGNTFPMFKKKGINVDDFKVQFNDPKLQFSPMKKNQPQEKESDRQIGD